MVARTEVRLRTLLPLRFSPLISPSLCSPHYTTAVSHHSSIIADTRHALANSCDPGLPYLRNFSNRLSRIHVSRLSHSQITRHFHPCAVNSFRFLASRAQLRLSFGTQ